MNCLHPIPVKVSTKKWNVLDQRWDTEILLVPCRKCNYCKRKLSLEWVRRLLHEYESNNYRGVFITLTYEDYWLLVKGIDKEELQLYFKRLRKRLNGRKIKYFACGEYGELNGRGHYHAIIINVTKREDKDALEKAWNMGFVDIKPVKYATAKYVVDYMHKDQENDAPVGMNPPFTLKSKGMGKNWLYKNIDDVLNNKGIMNNGHLTSIPRYYLKKLKETDKHLYDYLIESANDIPFDEIYYKNEIEYATEKHKKHITAIDQQLSSKKSLK